MPKSKPAAPTDDGIAPVRPIGPPPCCCCVTSAVIQNVRYIGATPTMVAGVLVANGHAFDFSITMDYSGGVKASDCRLRWFETVNIPAVPGHPANVETDMYALVPAAATFAPWNSKLIKCPGGGTLTVVITDVPTLGNAPGRTLTRTLIFRLVVESGAGCILCSQKSATATATQVLQMVNGSLVAAGTSFTTP